MTKLDSIDMDDKVVWGDFYLKEVYLSRVPIRKILWYIYIVVHHGIRSFYVIENVSLKTYKISHLHRPTFGCIENSFVCENYHLTRILFGNAAWLLWSGAHVTSSSQSV